MVPSIRTKLARKWTS